VPGYLDDPVQTGSQSNLFHFMGRFWVKIIALVKIMFVIARHPSRLRTLSAFCLWSSRGRVGYSRQLFATIAEAPNGLE
jgi:hypothetical protein